MCPKDSDLTEQAQEEIGRHRGMLTETDRELLLGYVDELTERAKKQRMVRLRRRVRNALMDGLELLQLEPQDRRLIFDPRDDGPEVRGGAIMLIKFLYMGLKEYDAESVEQAFMNAIEDAERQLGEEQDEYRDPQAHLSVNLGDRIPKDELREKLDAEASMSSREIAAAIDALDLTPEDWDALRRINESAVEQELEGYSTGVSLEDLGVGTGEIDDTERDWE